MLELAHSTSSVGYVPSRTARGQQSNARAVAIMTAMQATHGRVMLAPVMSYGRKGRYVLYAPTAGVSDDAHLVARTPDVDGNPYTVWRAREVKLARMRAIAQMLTRAPHPVSSARAWNTSAYLRGFARGWLRPSGHVSLPGERAIAPVRESAMLANGREYTFVRTTNPVRARAVAPRNIWRDPASMAPPNVAPVREVPTLGISFPDWAPLTSASPVRPRPRVTDWAELRDMARARREHGWGLLESPVFITRERAPYRKHVYATCMCHEFDRPPSSYWTHGMIPD